MELVMTLTFCWGTNMLWVRGTTRQTRSYALRSCIGDEVAALSLAMTAFFKFYHPV
ncbi:MAG: hypothetical protein JWR02_2589 [Mucilaginibacter sp.]|nr:hypothetical protein [Mucilaginibacter sp.]